MQQIIIIIDCWHLYSRSYFNNLMSMCRADVWNWRTGKTMRSHVVCSSSIFRSIIHSCSRPLAICEYHCFTGISLATTYFMIHKENDRLFLDQRKKNCTWFYSTMSPYVGMTQNKMATPINVSSEHSNFITGKTNASI